MSLTNWIPYKLLLEQDQALCRWLNTGDKPFSEPFFDDTITRLKSNGIQRWHSAGNIQLLPGWSKDVKAIKPSAFIFHISRCGSTLLSQLLSINPRHIVLSEVPFIDDVLRAPFKHHPQASFDQPDMLDAALRFYGQPRNEENKLFIKTDSWHVFFYKTFRKLYPKAAFILLYRKPEEVIRSHQKKRGMQAVPGVIEPEVFGFEEEPVTDLDAYMSRVIERYLTVFTDIIAKDERSILVNYNQGMMNVMDTMASFAGIDISAEEHAKMEERCRYHAKYPDQVFAEQQPAEQLPEYLQKCAALYDQLEQKRMSQR
jgi:hypothetical protein